MQKYFWKYQLLVICMEAIDLIHRWQNTCYTKKVLLGKRSYCLLLSYVYNITCWSFHYNISIASSLIRSAVNYLYNSTWAWEITLKSKLLTYQLLTFQHKKMIFLKFQNLLITMRKLVSFSFSQFTRFTFTKYCLSLLILPWFQLLFFLRFDIML